MPTTEQRVQANTQNKTCFVVMPVSDPEGYSPGHFGRVYTHLIKPACLRAGFAPLRADDVNRTNYIAIDILRNVISSDMMVCDLSARNPNVLYELGVRQAFNKPVALLKDRKTERIFDIQGLRTMDYDEQLRVDRVEADVTALAEVIANTATPPHGDVNSLVELLGVRKAELPQPIELSERDSIIMNALKELGDRVSSLDRDIQRSLPSSDGDPFTVQEFVSEGRIGELLGQTVYADGRLVGIVKNIDFAKEHVLIAELNGSVKRISMNDKVYAKLTTLPF